MDEAIAAKLAEILAERRAGWRNLRRAPLRLLRVFSAPRPRGHTVRALGVAATFTLFKGGSARCAPAVCREQAATAPAHPTQIDGSWRAAVRLLNLSKRRSDSDSCALREAGQARRRGDARSMAGFSTGHASRPFCPTRRGVHGVTCRSWGYQFIRAGARSTRARGDAVRGFAHNGQNRARRARARRY